MEMDFKALAAEREARRGMPKARAAPKVAVSELVKAPISVKLCRSLGGVIVCLALVLLCSGVLGAVRAAIVVAGAVWFARSAALHASMPFTQGMPPPTRREIESAASIGLFAGQLTAASLEAEWSVALESLAFCCTYGKTNCLTTAMYAEPLSLHRVTQLVWTKLREGVIKCD